MSERRRQSAAFCKLDDESFAEYRRLCLPRDSGGAGEKLERIVEWAAQPPRGVKLSLSMVHRDAEYFAATAEAIERVSRAGTAARQIATEAVAAGGVANLQQAAVNVFTQQVLDLLLTGGGVTDENAGTMAKVGAALAALTRAETQRSQAEDLKRRFDAEMAKLAARAGQKGITPERIADVRKAVFGV